MALNFVSGKWYNPSAIYVYLPTSGVVVAAVVAILTIRVGYRAHATYVLTQTPAGWGNRSYKVLVCLCLFVYWLYFYCLYNSIVVCAFFVCAFDWDYKHVKQLWSYCVEDKT